MDRRGGRQEAAPLPWRADARDRDAAPDRGRPAVPGPALPWLRPDAPRRAAGPPITRQHGPTAGRAGRRGPGATGPGALRDRCRDVLAGLRARGPVAVGAAAVTALALVAAAVVGTVHAVSGGPTVGTPFLSYTAPAGWTAEPAPVGALDTPTLTGSVRGPTYDCGGEARVRGFAAAALLPVDPTGEGAAGGRAERLARWFAGTAYAGADGAPAEVTLVPARPVRVDGAQAADGVVVEATVQAPARGDCPATTGTVVVLAAPVGGGAATLLVAGDTAGGPADPAPIDRGTLDAVLTTVRLDAR